MDRWHLVLEGLQSRQRVSFSPGIVVSVVVCKGGCMHWSHLYLALIYCNFKFKEKNRSRVMCIVTEGMVIEPLTSLSLLMP